MKQTKIVIVSDEQKEAFRKDHGYKCHFGYEYNAAYEMSACGGGAYTTASYGKIWAAVQDYRASRGWN